MNQHSNEIFLYISQQIQNTPQMGIKVSKSPSEILGIFCGVVFAATIPFMIAQMVIYFQFIESKQFKGFSKFRDNGKPYHCLSVRQNIVNLSLAQWLAVDQFSKLGIFIFVALMTALGFALRKERDSAYVIMLFCGVAIFVFFLYQLAWLIIGIYIFRTVTTNAQELALGCDENSIPFMYALSCLGVILVITCLVLSWLRPKHRDDFESSQESRQRKKNQKRKTIISKYQLPSQRRLRQKRY